MEFMSVSDAASLWNISECWIQKFCEAGRIKNVQCFERSWMIPKNAVKLGDPRKVRIKEGSEKHE